MATAYFDVPDGLCQRSARRRRNRVTQNVVLATLNSERTGEAEDSSFGGDVLVTTVSLVSLQYLAIKISRWPGRNCRLRHRREWMCMWTKVTSLQIAT